MTKVELFLTITSRISSIEVIRIKKNINSGLLVDPIPNSPNRHDKNCMADGEENYLRDLGSERVNPYDKVIWTDSITYGPIITRTTLDDDKQILDEHMSIDYCLIVNITTLT